MTNLYSAAMSTSPVWPYRRMSSRRSVASVGLAGATSLTLESHHRDYDCDDGDEDDDDINDDDDE